MTNVLMIHGGGPTPVINSSLAGVLAASRQTRQIDHLYGAKNGFGGALRGEWHDLTALTAAQERALLTSPGSAIGSSRDPLTAADYDQLLAIAKAQGIGVILLTGGNGTMATCATLAHHAAAQHLPVQVVGVPKTIDNDLAGVDHAPGYLSAANYLARTTREIAADVRGLPIHVVVIEAMGRDAGWLAAASALADQGDGLGPDLIYVPERPFVEADFLTGIKALYERQHYAVVVASEGLRHADGHPIVPPLFKQGRATYYGDVSSYLANLVIQRLGIKARGEKPGLAGRASIALQSPRDRAEAYALGKAAISAALAGQTGVMVGLGRDESAHTPEHVETEVIPLTDDVLQARTLPAEFIAANGQGVTPAFRQWLATRLGPLDWPPILSLN